MTRKKALLSLAFSFLILINPTQTVLAFPAYFSDAVDLEEEWEDWLEADTYYTMIAPDGTVIVQTGRKIYEGDQYLTQDNMLYEVVEVREKDGEYFAYTEFVREEKLPNRRITLNQIREQMGLQAAQGQSVGKIGIYHTHNAESYVPTDGTDSIEGAGGIHAVGEAFEKALEGLGIEVNYSQNLHLPHDRGAYRRSRETVLDLLSTNPDAIFDVHRDAAPKNAYATFIDEEWVTQIQFVVGRQNQNLGINRQYATSLKAVADQIFPGLIKGIFFGRGNYNQDLSPLNLLLEVGAHTNSREAAQRGIELFAEVVDFYFYGPREERNAQNQSFSLGSISTILWILAFLLAGTVVYYVINAGGWKEALARIRKHLTRN
ncbi:MAG: stage II sporulation protein P [Firmicutes bacterium]|nr:stage II sporulation protein P [Bacillota bacterium]